MNVSLYKATSSNIKLLLGLMREFYRGEHLRFQEKAAHKALRELLANPRLGKVFLIQAGSELAGYCVLTFGFSLEFHGHDALVDELFVRKEYRGKGIGKAVLNFLEEICRKKGIAVLYLEVDRGNEKAQRLYQRSGFEDRNNYLLTKWI